MPGLFSWTGGSPRFTSSNKRRIAVVMRSSYTQSRFGGTTQRGEADRGPRERPSPRERIRVGSSPYCAATKGFDCALEERARRGYYSSEEILACHQAGITTTLPKPITSGIEAKGRFGKQDFRYVAEQDTYICPAGEKLAYHFTNEEHGLVLRRYWTNACQSCAIKQRCTSGKERRITRWEHEPVLEEVQKRLDRNPQAMRQRRETAEHPFGTLKMRMGATHFLMKRLPKVATEMALHVLVYNLTRVINIMGIRPLMAAIRA
jgi:hypothetical protein